MSKIFVDTTVTQPRKDAVIRVRYYNPVPGSPLTDEYREVQLLEFHPDHDNRMKFRGIAYIKPEPWMEHSAYERWQGKSQECVAVREFMVHEADRRELYSYSNRYLSGRAIIIHAV